MVAELTQHRDVRVDPENEEAGTFKFVGGTTVIVDQSGLVRYAIRKGIGDPREDGQNRRLEQQRAYQVERAADMGVAAYLSETELSDRLKAATLDFRLVHRGY